MEQATPGAVQMALFPVALVSSEDCRPLLALIVHISRNATPHIFLFFFSNVLRHDDSIFKVREHLCEQTAIGVGEKCHR